MERGFSPCSIGDLRKEGSWRKPRWVLSSPPLAVSATGPWDFPVSETDLIARAQEILQYRFRDPDLLITSLRHSSGTDARVDSNERLEFLGDAVLGLVVCDELYHKFTTWLEGDLTKLKSVVVSRRVCAHIADEIGLTSLLICGDGINGQGRLPMSLRAAVFEAVIGAIYVDGGFDTAKEFILRSVSDQIDNWAASENRDNFKSALQQYAQRRLAATPRYESLDEKGPDHSKCFEICVVIGTERFPSAWGPSKKEAEQEAARRALEQLQGSPQSSTRHNG